MLEKEIEKLKEQIKQLEKDVEFYREWEDFHAQRIALHLKKAKEVYINIGGDRKKLYNMDVEKILTEIERMFKEKKDVK